MIERDELIDIADAVAAGRRVEPLEVVLRDGGRALIRPIVPEDKDRLRRGLDELSPRSRLLRFHAPIDQLTDEQLAYLTEIDYRDHFAWVATDPEHPDEPGMGVARYVRLRSDPEVAEAAVTVTDRHQGRGLGTLLLAVLAATAVTRGIAWFRNYVLDDNEVMLDLFDRVGAVLAHEGLGVYRVDVPLPADLDAVGSSPIGQVLRAAAAVQGRHGVLGIAFPPVWLRRWAERDDGDQDWEGAGVDEPGWLRSWVNQMIEEHDRAYPSP